MAITRGIKFLAFLVLALSFSHLMAEGHRGLATPPTCICQNNNNNNDSNDATKNNNTTSTTTNQNNNNVSTTNNNNTASATTTTKNNNTTINNSNSSNNNNTTTHKSSSSSSSSTTHQSSSSSSTTHQSTSNTTTHKSSSNNGSSNNNTTTHKSNINNSTTTHKSSNNNTSTHKNNSSNNNNSTNKNNSSNNNNNTTNTKNNNSNSSNSSSNNSNNNSSSSSNNNYNNNNNNNNNKNNNGCSNNTNTNTNNNNNNGIYDVTTFGAQGNGQAVYKNGDSMNGIALMQAWKKACYSSAVSAKVVIPKGTFTVAQVVFAGPCKTSNITIELQGNLVADPDVSQFPNHEFIVFQNVNGVTFTGEGTLDVSNQVNKSCDPNKNDADVFNQLSSVKLYKVNNVVVEGITSINPSSRHVLVVECQMIAIRNVKFIEKSVATNTKSHGIYISASTQVSVSNSIINTGEDCVTVAPGSSLISLTGLTCASGKGISIGSLAFLKNVLDVKGVLVKNCLFKGTTFGVSINPRIEASLSLISDINVEDCVMDGVQRPIVIKQQDDRLQLTQLILAKIMNVHFKNITGSVTTKNALSITCSLESPCEGIKVDDVDLSFVGDALKGEDDLNIIDRTMKHLKGLESLVHCLNAKVIFGGKLQGLSCGVLQ